jgi:hypothetical protein
MKKTNMKWRKISCLSMLASCSATGNKMIKNAHIPGCRNCIYYKPSTSDSEFASTLSRCEKFGEKNIVTNEIKYSFADSCRSDESKCGLEGRYFEEEPNIDLKVAIHFLKYNMPSGFVLILTALIIGLSLTSRS